MKQAKPLIVSSNTTKESETGRGERIEMIGATATKVIKDKTKYSRKPKYKEQYV